MAKESEKRQRSSESEVQLRESTLKRRHYAPPVSHDMTFANLRQMATRWLKAELEYYEKLKSTEDKLNYFPWIPENTKRSRKPKGPPVSHLVSAANEFARRFPFRSAEEEEDMNDELLSESPFLLVATSVSDNWEAPVEFQNEHIVRFMVVSGEINNESILFIKCMAGPEHGKFDGYISFFVDKWIIANDLSSFLSRVDAGGKGYQPDKAWRPKMRDVREPNLDASEVMKGAPFARLVIEVEYAHRGAIALREVGFAALDNPYTRLFLGVKIWKKNHAGNFAAAAILWGKNDDGVVSVRKAVDFGTNAMASISKGKFQEAGHAGMLPPVVVWTRPQPNPPHASLRAELDTYSMRQALNVPMNEEWGITLPAADLLYRTSTDESTSETPNYLDTNEATDCVINLQYFAWQLKDEVF